MTFENTGFVELGYEESLETSGGCGWLLVGAGIYLLVKFCKSRKKN